jgi:hypothetical protein
MKAEITMRQKPVHGVLIAILLILAAPARAVDPEAIHQAIDRGVAALKKLRRADGSWPHAEMGATALAGLTLLECAAAPNDPAVVSATTSVRNRSLTCTHTYSLALGVLFLDRLGDVADRPLIQSMAVRLLAGQDRTGGWVYQCPALTGNERARLTALIRRSKETERRDLPEEEGKRTRVELFPEVREQLERFNNLPAGRAPTMSDNSNTQFAILALWVARRHGVPIEKALTLIEARFRTTQLADLGWGYLPHTTESEEGTESRVSSPSMTCVGVLALAIVHGAVAEAVRAGDAKVRPRDIAKDACLLRGLAGLSTTIGAPGDNKERSPKPPETIYYFLWSLERVCVALDLDAIHTKDWYGWGAEFLLVNQEIDGSWQGRFGACGADTCFALLFLKRVNLLRDLTTEVKGKLRKSTERVLTTGVGIKDPGPVKPPREHDDIKPDPRPKDTPAARLASILVDAAEADRAPILDRLRDSKGVEYTEALAAAIPRLGVVARRQARAALAQRLARMKPRTLAAYLGDEEAEIRRAAAVACAQKELRSHIPALIPLLRDPVPAVVQAAHSALKQLSGEEIGPAPDAWQAWWDKHKE